MYGVLVAEAKFSDLLFKVLDAVGNVRCLIVEHKRHEVKGRMGFVVTKVS